MSSRRNPDKQKGKEKGDKPAEKNPEKTGKGKGKGRRGNADEQGFVADAVEEEEEEDDDDDEGDDDEEEEDDARKERRKKKDQEKEEAEKAKEREKEGREPDVEVLDDDHDVPPELRYKGKAPSPAANNAAKAAFHQKNAQHFRQQCVELYAQLAAAQSKLASTAKPPSSAGSSAKKIDLAKVSQSRIDWTPSKAVPFRGGQADSNQSPWKDLMAWTGTVFA